MTDRTNRRTSRIVFTLILSIIAALVGYVTARAWNGSRSVFISGRNPFAQVASFLLDNNKLIGENRGQVNILLLGVGGEGHEGTYLSDTIMLASLRPGDGEISLTSIPRDTIISIPGIYGSYKINNAYALATAKFGPKVGLAQAREAVSDFLDLDIPYAVVVDFDGFIKAVDTLGGIDVQIEKTFTDNNYPNERFGYIAPITFKTGVEHMNGRRALMYARSRYSTSDFDRARRQQKLIEAFSSRARELNLLKDILTINRLFDNFTAHVYTNLDPGEVKRFADLSLPVPQNKIYTTVIDPTTGLVCSFSSSELGYHLKPCPGRAVEDVQKFVALQFARGRAARELTLLELQNATSVAGLALEASEHFKSFNFSIQTANAAKLTDSSKTIVYDLTGGQKPDSLAVLLLATNGKLGRTAPQYKGQSKPDFIITLGNDYRPPYLDVINLDPPKPEEDDKNNDDNDDNDNIKKTNPPEAEIINAPKTEKKSENTEPQDQTGVSANS